MIIPAVILHSAVGKTDLDREQVLLILGVSMGMFLILILVSRILCKILKWNGTYELMLIYSNLGFMGIPIVTGIYGEDKVFWVSLVMMICNIALFSHGVITLKREEGVHVKDLLNPGVLSAIVAILIFWFHIPIPSFVDDIVLGIGNSMTPLAMMVIGSSIASVKMERINWDKSVCLFIIFKLFLMPAIIFLCFYFVISNKELTAILTVLIALPVGGNVPMLCSQYDGDLSLASKGLCITTLLSIITVPAICWVLALIV